MNYAANPLSQGSPKHGSTTSDPHLITIAVFAVGGQGGGVLSDWIVSLARRHGWSVQSTAVAGVAQRTGATFYYIEIAEPSDRRPVFALAPAAGNVDIVIAAELMEAGRAIMRGFVTPDRTTLIASSHRMLSVAEKVVPGNGIRSSEEVLKSAKLASAKQVILDFQQVASDCGTVISASLLGGLAASQALPFNNDAYTQTIADSGRGVAPSTAAFNRVLELALPTSSTDNSESNLAPATFEVSGPKAQISQWENLYNNCRSLPAAAQPIARAGLKKVVDYQDLAYGKDYLERLRSACIGDNRGVFSCALAKHLANAMCYDDVIRVADLKTRASRRSRINAEYGADNSLVQTTEFMRPRVQELSSLLPPSVAGWLNKRQSLMRWLDRWVNRGRRLRSDRLLPFMLLYSLAGLRRWRRAMIRHQVEMKRIEDWLSLALEILDENYDLAVEVLNCRRLVKGYSDTHSRGLSKYQMLMTAIQDIRVHRDAAARLKDLIALALAESDSANLRERIERLKKPDAPASPCVHHRPVD